MKHLLPVLIPALLVGLSHSTTVVAAKKGELYTTAVTTQGDSSTRRPRNSQTKESVITEFGEPDNKIAAIGEPPISRWEYPKYNVFFEYDRVIHTVLKR